MYRHKSNEHKQWVCCPMGTLHDNIVECYYYGVVKIDECENCKVRKDAKKIKK